MRIKTTLLLLLLFISRTGIAQNKQVAIVDKNGILRWKQSKEEIKGFGTNYTLPFAYAYRNAIKKGLTPEKLIEEDVYQFARLGFDLFRVHVWDTEISDSTGNLLQNEHLRLFDYLVQKLKERRIRLIITPIAFWGNGWPEPDEATPGFSARYGKDACLTNPFAIKAQQNYLYQLLNHVNPYTGLAYKDDDAVIAFEISNEPHHREAVDTVKQFINKMVAAMRKTGTQKPILYNISHSQQSADAYFSANIQGGTFQWYPTGLGARHELGGNLLPNVDTYTIPYVTHPGFKKQAKIVYEFDAADVGRSYIYPAMARSFRTAGLQLATQFAYDPTYTAYANTEYGTHYMNLLYTPQKALGLRICSEIFHSIPLYSQFGSYPADTSFGPFRVNAENDLAEMVTHESFIYTNSTTTQPPQPAQLKQVAGTGNSPVVQYGGTGTYFLDRISEGVWRLEVLPDVVWIHDPFDKTSLNKPVAVLNKRSWPMQLNVTGLGPSFHWFTISKDTIHFAGTAGNATIVVEPGVYLLSSTNTVSLHATDTIGNIQLFETVHVPGTVQETHVVHQPASELSEGNPASINATIISREEPTEVELYVQMPGSWYERLPMHRSHGYQYAATLPASKMKQGFIQYYIVVHFKDSVTSFPGAQQQHPAAWDFTHTQSFSVPVKASHLPIYLFTAAADHAQLLREWRKGSQLIPLAEDGQAGLSIHLETLEQKDPENPAAVLPADYSMRFFFGKKIAGRSTELDNKTKLIIRIQSNQSFPLQVALANHLGQAFGALVELIPGKNEYSVLFSDLKPVPLVLLPRPYPGFLPYYFQTPATAVFDITTTENLLLSVGPGIPASEVSQKRSFLLQSVRVE